MGGEGKDKTDRSNMVQIHSNNIGGNYHLPLNHSAIGNGLEMPWNIASMNALAWIGQTACSQDAAVINNDQNDQNCAKLNGVNTPYFDAGLLKGEKAMNLPLHEHTFKQLLQQIP